MDNLSWDDPSSFRNETSFPPCNWSKEALLKSSSQLQGIETCDAGSDLHSLSQIMESINETLNPDLIQHEEAIRLAAADSALATFGIGTIWGDTLTSQLCSLPPIIHQELQALHDTGDEEVSAVYPIYDEAASQCSSYHDAMPIKKRKLGEYEGRQNCHPYDLLQASSSTTEGGFQIIFENSSKLKKPKSEKCSGSSNIDFRPESGYEPDTEAIAQLKEMIYRAAALRPVNLGVMELQAVEKPKRKNVKISSDPQTVAARHRRERISERLRVLQRLVPGGSKLDTASMLDEAANYLKFLKSQVSALEAQGSNAVPFLSPFNQAISKQTPFLLSQNLS